MEKRTDKNTTGTGTTSKDPTKDLANKKTGLSTTTTQTSDTKNTATGNKVSVYYPSAEITIVTEIGNLVIKGEITPNVKDFGKDILSIITKRSLSSDAPTFSLNLVYRDEWFYSISSNDLVIIKMCRPPEKLKTTFIGLVDDCRRSFVYNQDKPKRVLSITGRGVCKAFVSFNIGIVSEVEVSENYLGYLGREVNIEGCATNDAIHKLITAYAGAYIDYTFSDKTTLLKRIQLKLAASPDYTLIDVSNLLNYQGSLWQLMKEIQNAPFNEMFWEIENEKPTLCLRSTPFSKDLWNGLGTTEILDEEIINDSLGRSDLETYTLYSVSCSTMLSSTSATSAFGYVPLWYPPYFKKYGVRRLDAVSMYSMYAGSEDQDKANDRSMTCTRNLFNWNIKNNSMYNGTLVLRGSNRHKLGSRITLKSEGLELYVEGITQIFNVFESYQVQLDVTRGLPPQDRFTPPYEKYETFDPSIFGIKASDTTKDKKYGASLGHATGTAADIINLAKKYLGTLYCYGGCSPETGFDCSGLVQYCYGKYGINLPRISQDQVNCGTSIDVKDQSKWKPGDLVFSNPQSDGPGHVSIYIGDGQKIHAPGKGKNIAIAPVGTVIAVKRVL